MNLLLLLEMVLSEGKRGSLVYNCDLAEMDSEQIGFRMTSLRF